MIKKVFSYLDHTIEFFIFMIFVLMVIVGGMQVFNRFVLNQSLSWSEEFQKFAHIWLIFFTIPVGYNRGSHIGMRMVVEKFPQKMQQVFIVITHVLWLGLGGAMVFFTTFIMRVAKFQTSPGLGVRMDLVYLSLVIGGAYLAIVALRKLTGYFLQSGPGHREGDASC
jgi:TRAP-type C4-dicarboxylate transport system permease small subunit